MLFKDWLLIFKEYLLKTKKKTKIINEIEYTYDMRYAEKKKTIGHMVQVLTPSFNKRTEKENERNQYEATTNEGGINTIE